MEESILPARQQQQFWVLLHFLWEAWQGRRDERNNLGLPPTTRIASSNQQTLGWRQRQAGRLFKRHQNTHAHAERMNALNLYY
jgi:hypothetical protein